MWEKLFLLLEVSWKFLTNTTDYTKSPWWKFWTTDAEERQLVINAGYYWAVDAVICGGKSVKQARLEILEEDAGPNDVFFVGAREMLTTYSSKFIEIRTAIHEENYTKASEMCRNILGYDKTEDKSPECKRVEAHNIQA